MQPALTQCVAASQLPAQGLGKATEVIFTGGSAGGLAVYLHADFVATQLPPGIKYRALGGAGFFLDHPSITGAPVIHDQFVNAFALWNSSSGVNDACIKGNPGREWRCIFAQYTWPYITSRFFVMEGMYDRCAPTPTSRPPGHWLRTRCTNSRLGVRPPAAGSS